MMLIIGVIALLLLIFELLKNFSEYKIYSKAIKHRGFLNLFINEKTMITDYENISCKQGQDQRQKAVNAVVANWSGTEAGVKECAEFLKNFCGIVIYGVILLTLNPWILAILFIGAAINLFASKYAIRFEHKHKDDYAPIDSKLNYMREQSVQEEGAKDIRIYSMAGWFMELYKRFIGERERWYFRVEMHDYFPNVVDAIIVLLRDGIAYAYLISRVLSGLPVGDFILYFGAITGFSMWLAGAVKNVIEINRAALSVDDMRNFLDIKDLSNRGEGIHLPNSNELPCSVELKNVSYKYPDSEEYVIRNMNLKIEKGEKLAMVGVNGAGKTTVVKLICGLVRPNEGKILLNGKEVDDYNILDYQSMFSVAFQDASILSFRISENVSMKPVQNTDMDKVKSVLELSGLGEKIQTLKDGADTYINNIIVDDGIELSGGEKQKLILARALYKNAPILILDEPTAALDPIAESKLYDQYAEFSKDKTSIYISHRLASTRFCDRIIFLEDGEIIESGSHDVLMNNGGKYSHMFDVQSHYYKSDLEVGA
jgi:ABC-type multidrug transport system fused ATPase/permease subunit